jgi:hypothetical protein
VDRARDFLDDIDESIDQMRFSAAAPMVVALAKTLKELFTVRRGEALSLLSTFGGVVG